MSAECTGTPVSFKNVASVDRAWGWTPAAPFVSVQPRFRLPPCVCPKSELWIYMNLQKRVFCRAGLSGSSSNLSSEPDCCALFMWRAQNPWHQLFPTWNLPREAGLRFYLDFTAARMRHNCAISFLLTDPLSWTHISFLSGICVICMFCRGLSLSFCLEVWLIAGVALSKFAHDCSDNNTYIWG